jgi:chloramphenicol O-acetyltransferase type A
MVLHTARAVLSDGLGEAANMKFTPIDLQTWPRGQMFYYFSKMAPTGYSLTVDLDVTQMRSTLKKVGLKYFPAYLWLVTKMLNRHVEFKVAELDGQLGYYDTLTPLYATFHEDDKNFSLMWTDFNEDFSVFYQHYLKSKERYGENHGVLAQPETPPPANCYTVSCVPWITFSHFAVHSYENKPYYFPSIESGKFYEKDGRTLMPLSITCHHATTDGYHVSCFLTDLQKAMDCFQV